MSTPWPVGVCCALIGSSFESLGMVLQRRAFLLLRIQNSPKPSSDALWEVGSDRETEMEDLSLLRVERVSSSDLDATEVVSSTRSVPIDMDPSLKHAREISFSSLLRSPTWYLGMFSMIVGSVFNLIASALSEQRVIVPLASLALVSNAAFSAGFLGEPFTKADGWGTFVIVASLIVMVSSSPPPQEKQYSAEQLRDLLGQPSMIVFLVLFTLYFAFLLTVVLWHACFRKSNPKKSKSEAEGNPSHSSSSPSAFIRSAYASLSGMIAASTTLSSKSSSEIIKTTFRGDNQFTSAYAFFSVICMLTSATMQVYTINKSLALSPALFHIPFQFVNWMSFAIVGASIWLGDFNGFSSVQLLLYTCCVFGLFIGVYIISKRPSFTEEQGEEFLVSGTWACVRPRAKGATA